MQKLTAMQFATLTTELQQACMHRLPGNKLIYLRSYSTEVDSANAVNFGHPARPFANFLDLESGHHQGYGFIGYDTSTNMVVLSSQVTESGIEYVQRLMASMETQMRVFASAQLEFQFAQELPDGRYELLKEVLEEYNSVSDSFGFSGQVIQEIHGHSHGLFR